jgi:3-methylcrotonyl-CoA carboxylase beta subunit
VHGHRRPTRDRADVHRALVADLREKLAPAAAAARSGPRPRTSSAGSCCPASGSTRCSTRRPPFLELSPLAAHGLYGGEAPAPG